MAWFFESLTEEPLSRFKSLDKGFTCLTILQNYNRLSVDILSRSVKPNKNI